MVGEGMADAVTPDAATRVVGSEVTRSTAAEAASMVAVAGSTVVVADSTVAAVATAAAGIGNLL
jgi:hypothetical protein